MIEEIGIVKRVFEGRAEIEVDRKSMCAGCKAACRLIGTGKMKAIVRALPHLKEGDKVIVEIPEKLVLESAIMAYGLPLAFFLLGFMLAKFLFKLDDIYSFLAAILSLALSYPIVRIYGKRREDRLIGKIKEIL